MIREIVTINEDLCDGCGECVPNCHEGALQIIDGKARLISELMCDGLGACLGHCPQGAITIEKREAENYDEELVIASMVKSGKATVFAHLKHLQEHNETGYLAQALKYIKDNQHNLTFSVNEVHELLYGKNRHRHISHSTSRGCPGSASSSFNATNIKLEANQKEQASALTQWPVQLHLINPAAENFKDSDLLVAADCVGYAYGNFHQKFLAGKKLVIACPKLDNAFEIYTEKLKKLITVARVNAITVVIMEVPCCRGLVEMVKMLRNTLKGRFL